MPTIRVNQVDLYYHDIGSGPETIVFSHGYLMDHTMFAGQYDSLKSEYRIIAYDHRGHGRSEPVTEGYEMENLYRDAESLIEALDLGPAIFVGMSTGGFIGLRLAIRRPDLIKALVLMDTSAEPEPPDNLSQYNLLLNAVRFTGWRLVIGRVMPILFHQTFLKDPARQAEVKRWREIVTGHHKPSVIAFGRGIFAREGVTDQLSEIVMPTAVIVGEQDVATTPEKAQTIADGIVNAQLFTIPDAGHSAAVEQPTAVLRAMRQFLATVPASKES